MFGVNVGNGPAEATELAQGPATNSVYELRWRYRLGKGTAESGKDPCDCKADVGLGEGTPHDAGKEESAANEVRPAPADRLRQGIPEHRANGDSQETVWPLQARLAGVVECP